VASIPKRSPIKAKPLRLPGQSVQEAIDNLLWDGVGPYIAIALMLVVLAGIEWLAVVRHIPRQPWLLSGLALVATSCAGLKCWRVRARIRQLNLGRDGERVVGQYLERLRANGADVFHDVPGDEFNVDHVVLSVHGFFAVETKTHSKPASGEPRVALTEDGVMVNRLRPDRDPLVQAQAGAKWLSELLEESTGKRFAVRGVVLYPGWFVEPMSDAWRRSPEKPWVLNPKALPVFIGNQSAMIPESDVKLAAYHLSRYVRAASRS
jgi:hypothetical protein